MDGITKQTYLMNVENLSLVNTFEDLASQSEATKLTNVCNIQSDERYTAAYPSILFCKKEQAATGS